FRGCRVGYPKANTRARRASLRQGLRPSSWKLPRAWLLWSDSIGVALVAFIVAGTIHSINHALDRHLGGHSFDQWGLGGLVLLAVAALIIHLRGGSRHEPRT